MGIIVVKECQEADEFLEQLSTRGPIFGGTEASGSRPDLGDAWIFRGHDDDDYVLLPSEMRHEHSFAKFGERQCVDNESQIRAELGILRQFINLADATGLPLPEDSQALRSSIQVLFAKGPASKLAPLSRSFRPTVGSRFPRRTSSPTILKYRWAEIPDHHQSGRSQCRTLGHHFELGFRNGEIVGA
jgi:hypothetical protein